LNSYNLTSRNNKKNWRKRERFFLVGLALPWFGLPSPGNEPFLLFKKEAQYEAE
jgi:hypothetical protein